MADQISGKVKFLVLGVLAFCVSVFAHEPVSQNLRARVQSCHEIFSKAEKELGENLGESHHLISNAIYKVRLRAELEGNRRSVEPVDVDGKKFEYLRDYLSGEKAWPSERLKRETVATEMARGYSLNAALAQFEISREVHQFYDPESGNLRYRGPEQILEVETGKTLLDIIHIGFAKHANLAESAHVLSDYARAMERLKTVKLLISTPFKWQSYVEYLVSRFPKRIRSRMIVVPVKSDGNVWTQDYIKPLASGRAGLVSATSMSHDGVLGAIEMQELGIIDVLKSPDTPAGGNLVVGSRHIFMGADALRGGQYYFRASHEDVVQFFEKQYGKAILEVGYPYMEGRSLEQPSFHIDLSLALARDQEGTEVVLVHSPALFLEALGIPNLLSLKREEYYVYLEKFLKRCSEPLSLNEKYLVQNLTDVDFNDLVAEELRHSVVAKMIEDHGYRVLRMPGKNNQKRGRHSRGQPAFNYVNVVFSGPWALVPYFGIPALDESAYSIYRKLGYEVLSMSSASYTLRLGGGIRCTSTTFRKTP